MKTTANRDPLAAVPVIADGVEARKDSRGCVQIRAMKVSKKALGRLAERLGMQRQTRVNLDEYGTLFWELIDGKKSLRAIAEVICKRTEQGAEDCEKAVIKFTQMLMMRHLILLAVPKGGGDHE